MGMTGIEKIVEQIESAACADAETLLGSGRAESAAVLRDYGLRADALAKKTREHTARQLTQTEQRIRNQMHLQQRSALLSTRRAMVEQAFQNALQALEQLDGARREKLCLALARTVVSPEEEGEVLLFPEDRDTVGAAFTAQYPKLRIAKENCGAPGFLLRFGAVEVDCTFRSVLEELREPLAARVAQALFGEAHADEG